MTKLKKICFFLTGKQKTQSVSTHKPCILTSEQTEGLLESEVLRIYEPALKNPGIHISLTKTSPLKFPLSEQELKDIKAGLRYVWCDGFEASQWTPHNCKYLGIRLSDSFILHETVIKATWEEYICQWRKKCQARFLLQEEIMMLNLVWDEVSAMRQQAGDRPLPDCCPRYWVFQPKAENYLDRYVHVTRNGQLLERGTETNGSLLMAVTN